MNALGIRTALGMVLVAVVSLVSACGTSSESVSAGQPSTSAPAVTTEPTATTEAAPVPSSSTPVAAANVPAALDGARTVDGQPFDAQPLAGMPTVLWFWAPWCTVCRGEAPDLVEVSTKYAGRVNFVGVAGLGEAAEMQQFVDDTSTGGFVHLNDNSGDIWSSYGIISQPAFAFIAADGSVETFKGAMPIAELSKTIDSLIAAT